MKSAPPYETRVPAYMPICRDTIANMCATACAELHIEGSVEV